VLKLQLLNAASRLSAGLGVASQNTHSAFPHWLAGLRECQPRRHRCKHQRQVFPAPTIRKDGFRGVDDTREAVKMGTGEAEANPLTSTQKSSDSLAVVLHPLVLLTISDYFTRHTLRNLIGPIVGAILGQQNGREITLEHTFDVLVQQCDDVYCRLDEDWFADRLEQSTCPSVSRAHPRRDHSQRPSSNRLTTSAVKLVHKDRELELVGYYAVLPRSGPTRAILPLHNQFLLRNESALLLAFHADELLEPSVGGKLPVTVYETVPEAVDDGAKDGAQAGSEDLPMEDGTEDLHGIKFRELPYTVETGEAEMISIDFVAQGATNAAAADDTKPPAKKEPSAGKGKQRAAPGQLGTAAPPAEIENTLLREDEELISALTAKANAIKMLRSRIQLITAYLEQLPPSYLTGSDEASSAGADDTAAAAAANGPSAAPSYTILRWIQALVNHLPLLVPSAAESEAFEREMLSESNDVHLVALFSDIMQSVQEIRDMGKKHVVLEAAKNAKPSRGADFASPGGSFNLGSAGDIMA